MTNNLNLYVLGRILMPWVFVVAAIGKFMNVAGVAGSAGMARFESMIGGSVLVMCKENCQRGEAEKQPAAKAGLEPDQHQEAADSQPPPNLALVHPILRLRAPIALPAMAEHLEALGNAAAPADAPCGRIGDSRGRKMRRKRHGVCSRGDKRCGAL